MNPNTKDLSSGLERIAQSATCALLFPFVGAAGITLLAVEPDFSTFGSRVITIATAGAGVMLVGLAVMLFIGVVAIFAPTREGSSQSDGPHP